MNLSQSQIKSIVKIALKAGKIAMSYFGGSNLNISKKPDNTTLTIADSLISDLIYEGLRKITPKIPIICEEGKNRDSGDGTFWLIDPIDGTSSFADGDPEFTINIALVKNQKPIFGLIFAPAISSLPFYYTDENGQLTRFLVKEKKTQIVKPQKRHEKDFIVIASKRSPNADILNYFKDKKIAIYKVSSSLKFIYLIEGKADFYLHLRKSMQWDIAAGQALLEAAGGKVVNLDGSEFLYKKGDLENKPFMAML